MSEAWVINASPLILLARVDRLDLIERLAPAVLVPDAVVVEVKAGQHKDPSSLRALEWVQSRRTDDVPLINSLERWDLGAGESQVIAYCSGRPRWAVLDDQAARRCAAAHGVSVIGTLGIVLRAKVTGEIELARPIVEALIAAGMFLDEDLVADVLARVGE